MLLNSLLTYKHCHSHHFLLSFTQHHSFEKQYFSKYGTFVNTIIASFTTLHPLLQLNSTTTIVVTVTATASSFTTARKTSSAAVRRPSTTIIVAASFAVIADFAGQLFVVGPRIAAAVEQSGWTSSQYFSHYPF